MTAICRPRSGRCTSSRSADHQLAAFVTTEERPPEELDQEYAELLSELRVVIPGVQLLAAFLLILPFNARFAGLTAGERGVYFVAFLAAVLASVLTIAPSAQHRIRWREGDKEALLKTANRLTIGGTAALTVALSGSVFLVGQVLYKELVASVVAAGMIVAMVWWWFLQPILRRARESRKD